MKLIQLNVWGGRLDNTLLDFLAKEKPEIFCGQELINYSFGDSIAFAPAELMQKKMKLKNYAFAPLASFKYMEDVATFGNGIMTNNDILSSKIEFTNLGYVDNFNFEKHSYNMRNFIHATLSVNGQKLHILTHHGFHVPHTKEGNSETDCQIKQISQYISALKGPIIFTGDLNLSPKSKSLEPINSILKNLSIDYELKTTRNILTNKSEVCDYIFISNDIKIKNFKASKEIVSDHQALILEFEL